MRLKVGYVLKRYPRFSETFVVNEILAHEAAGLDLEIFSLRPPEDAHFQDIIGRVRAPVTYLTADAVKAAELWAEMQRAGAAFPGLWAALGGAPGHDVREVYQAVLLARLVHERGIRHLHAHFATSATTVARLAARFAGVPYTLTTHAKDIFHERVDPEDLRRKLRDAAAVVAVSDYHVAYLGERFGSDAARAVRLYNGIDLASLPYQAPTDRGARIVAVGRLVPKKGFADLVEACGLLAARGRRFECRIIGTGELEGALRAEVDKRGLGGRVVLTGALPRAEMEAHLRGAAALAAPCVVGADHDRDGLPTVLLEAMALGTPCVSTDVAGIPEVVHHGETGLMVPQRDPAALADALERLLDDAALRVRLAEAARRLVERDFDAHRNAARLREVFLRACEAPEALATEAR